MKSTLIAAVLGTLCFVASVGLADDPADVGANLAAQTAADVLRSYAGADGAFIHAGFLKPSVDKNDLSSYLSYPTDGIAVLNLKGSQIRDALEFSVSLYPESNYSFLQLSGFEVIFKKSGEANHRITSVTHDGAALDENRTYSVAMPSLLARGAVGYRKYWARAKPAKEFGTTTMEDILKGKPAAEGSPRWVAQN